MQTQNKTAGLPKEGHGYAVQTPVTFQLEDASVTVLGVADHKLSPLSMGTGVNRLQAPPNSVGLTVLCNGPIKISRDPDMESYFQVPAGMPTTIPAALMQVGVYGSTSEINDAGIYIQADSDPSVGDAEDDPVLQFWFELLA